MKKGFLTVLLMMSVPALADMPVFEITIKDHQYDPAQLIVPANQRIKLLVENQDNTPEEFEGTNFDAEKVIPGRSKAAILVGPFAPGQYEFIGEFHQETAQGLLIVE